jgi:hypothetical protein
MKKFELSRVAGTPVSDDDLIADMKLVAQKLNLGKVTIGKYSEHGIYDPTTISRRFGSWNKALSIAGLYLSNEVDISDERLFENLLTLWRHYGRQPRFKELYSAPSTISQGPYKRRFSSWSATLEAFVNYANGSGIEVASAKTELDNTGRRKTGREPSLRLRWHVLQEDHFKIELDPLGASRHSPFVRRRKDLGRQPEAATGKWVKLF